MRRPHSRSYRSARPPAPSHSWMSLKRSEMAMTHIIVLFGGLFVGALAGVLVMAALIAAGTASELERRFAGADGPRRKIAGPSGDSPSYFRGPGIGSPMGDPSPWDSMRRIDNVLVQPPSSAGKRK